MVQLLFGIYLFQLQYQTFFEYNLMPFFRLLKFLLQRTCRRSIKLEFTRSPQRKTFRSACSYHGNYPFASM